MLQLRRINHKFVESRLVVQTHQQKYIYALLTYRDDNNNEFAISDYVAYNKKRIPKFLICK